MVLDQQVPLERAFRSPYDLQERLGGHLDAAALASMDPEALAAVFSERPALHRFPKSMAGRVQEVCAVIVDSYGGDAAAIWTSAADGKQLLANVKALPGFGEQKARIFVALLGKQLGVRPPGWEKAASPFGDTGHLPVGGRHRLARGPGQGPPVQAEDEGQGQGRGPGGQVRLTRPVATPDRWGLADRRLYLCTPDRPDLERFVEACIDGRRGHRPAAGEAPGRRPTGRAGLAGAAGLRGARRAVHPQRPTGPGRGHRRRRRPRGPGRHVSPVEARRLVGDDAIIGLSTHAVPSWSGPSAVRDRWGHVAADRTGRRPGARPVPLGRPGDPHADQARTARDRPRLCQRGGGPLALAGVDHRRGRSDHGRAHGRGRCPALRGGPVAHRGGRPAGQLPAACVRPSTRPSGRPSPLGPR